METPGNLLKAEREKQKKSYKDIADTLKINIEYLKALENDNYHLLPADIFTVSYLRSYSKTLGLESDHIVNLYKKQLGTPSEKQPAPSWKLYRKILDQLNLNYLLLVMIFVVLVTVSLIVYIKYGTEKSGVAAAVSSAASEAQKKDMSLKIAATELTWVSVRSDSAEAAEHLLRAKETLTFKAEEKFVLKVGNAGSTSIFFNGADIGPLGSRGQVVDIVLP